MGKITKEEIGFIFVFGFIVLSFSGLFGKFIDFISKPEFWSNYFPYIICAVFALFIVVAIFEEQKRK